MNYKTVQRLFKYTGFFLALLEKAYLIRYSRNKIKYPVVFIVGPPRSGSTILYQLITNTLDVNYINNLIDAAKENINVGFTVSQILFKNKPHNSFQSDFGKTLKDGLNAPSEGSFWYKWLPRDHHYLTAKDVTKKNKIRIKSRLTSIVNRYRKPFLIKNLSFSVRLDLIYELFPDARFIFIYRDKTENVISILKARHKNKIPKNKIWSIMPENYQEIEQENNEMMMVVKQIYYIEKQIYNDFKLFPDQQKMSVGYENLLNDPVACLDKIKEFVMAKNKTGNQKLPELFNNYRKTKINVPDKLKKYMTQFNWDNYNE